MICRQMGYDLGALDVLHKEGTNASDPLTLHDMKCQGHENHILQCQFEDHHSPDHSHACDGTEKLAIKCRKALKKCEDYEFHCENKECIHVNSLCDGTDDCADGSDEVQGMCQLPLQVSH